MNQARPLPTFTKNGVKYFIDFRLEEIRPANMPFMSISFDDLDEKQKAILRRIRAIYSDNVYLQGLDG